MTTSPFTLFEAETLAGLERFALEELKSRLGSAGKHLVAMRGAVLFNYNGALQRLHNVRVSTAIYGSMTFDVPRPKALLGHEHFKRIVSACRIVMQSSAQSFDTIGLDAAGHETSVMQRFISELANTLQLAPSENRGDLNIRLRHPRSGTGWEVLIRLTPKPLATRSWRVVNYQGALYGPLAYVMASLTKPQPQDKVLNLACGSASLLIERGLQAPAQVMAGCDLSEVALTAAVSNLRAAGVVAQLTRADATQLPYPTGFFDSLLADLPFGNLIGSHTSNLTLYPAVLAEAARVTKQRGCFVLITHEKRLLHRVLHSQSTWMIEHTFAVNQNGLHPEIFVLRRVD